MHDSTVMQAPPARGWTGLAVPSSALEHAGPASAGVDRNSGGGGRAPSRRPCQRGGGPWESFGILSKETQAPPERGWTELGLPIAVSDTAVPASAGVDRRWLLPGQRTRSRPRQRGGGPNPAVFGAEEVWQAPPARGWTG